MKKLYLLLVSSVLLVGSAGALTVSVAGCGPEKKIKDIAFYLREFNKKHPLWIPYFNDTNQNERTKSHKTIIDDELKDALIKQEPQIFTRAIVSKISFQNEVAVHPEIEAQLKATYRNKTTPFWVEEKAEYGVQQVIQSLYQFNYKDHPVLVDKKYNNQYADSDLVSKAIRQYLVAHDQTKIIDATNNGLITFYHSELQDNDFVRVLAIYDHWATYILVKTTSTASLLVDNALRKFSKPNLRLKIQESQKEVDSEHSLVIANDPFGTKKIRDALVAQGGLSRDLAQQINFGDTLIACGTYDEQVHRAVPDSGRKWHTTAKFGKNVKVEIFGSTNL